ncbi:unnamed protein product [Rotaria magnacalcarata]|uniref:Uncharacterized protein n=1 Tax=Rotaria magnacalcarata TaxID=392030 RepID=A0A816R5L7_9BILA|nr:unnamed protein product [Rotaria magnacalcarata]
MGHLLARMATLWLEQQTLSNAIENGYKPIHTKRKRTDQDDVSSNKRKIINNSTVANDSDSDERLSLSPRVSPIMSKVTKSSHSINHLMPSTVTSFKCQLCRRSLRNKDIYMDHMIICAVQRQVSIKIVRTNNKEKKNDEVSKT